MGDLSRYFFGTVIFFENFHPHHGCAERKMRSMSVLQILVVDNDPWTVQMVSSLLSQRGHQVQVAHAPAEATAMVSVRLPDLVVADAKLDEAGLGWLLSLRESVPERRLPVLLLAEEAPPALRLEALRLADSDFLDKPFRFDEFDLRVERLLRRPGLPVSPGPADGPRGLRGTLGELSLASILLLLESERKSGVLTVERAGEVGRLWCGAGKLLSAELSVIGQRPERSLDAVFSLLCWSSGDFSFESGPEPEGEDEGLSMTQLVIQLAQRQDERAAKEAVAV